MKPKYKWCKTCVANEWYPLRPPTRYKKTNSKILIISSKLFEDTIIDAIKTWAVQQEAVDKFGDIALVQSQNDLREVASFILRKFKHIESKIRD